MAGEGPTQRMVQGCILILNALARHEEDRRRAQDAELAQLVLSIVRVGQRAMHSIRY